MPYIKEDYKIKRAIKAKDLKKDDIIEKFKPIQLLTAPALLYRASWVVTSFCLAYFKLQRQQGHKQLSLLTNVSCATNTWGLAIWETHKKYLYLQILLWDVLL
ncbi:MAG: hypothetical protein ABI675_26405 [Chitinophagaceae bacterium]